MLGERILFKRIDGKVYAIEDRCVHRGVPFSVRPECYTKNTISCWYHGFTYDLRDGELVAIITDPESPLIGRVKLKAYPVEEHKNLVFAFIGDEAPHPLALDLQPGFLDDDLAMFPNGEHEIVKSNWRLAAENGVDASHIYIHRNSALINAARRPLPLSSYFTTREGMVVDQDGAPKGVVKGAGRKTLVWETEIEGVKIASQYRPGVNTEQSQRHQHLAVAALRPQGRPVPEVRHHAVRVVRSERRTVPSLHRHLGQAGGGCGAASEQFFREMEVDVEGPRGAQVQQRGRDRARGHGAFLRRGGRLESGAPVPARPDHRGMAQACEQAQPGHPAQAGHEGEGDVSTSPPDPPPGSPRYAINRAVIDLCRNPECTRDGCEQGGVLRRLSAERRGAAGAARRQWRRLLDLGVLPNLVYRYYMLHGLAPETFSTAIAAKS